MDDRSISEQVIDLILAEDANAWDEYSRVLQEFGIQNLHDLTEEDETLDNSSVVVEFLARWSAIESALSMLSEQASENATNYRRGSVTSTKVAQQFLGNHVMPLFEYTRALRNELVHSRTSPGRDELTTAIEFLDELLSELSDHSAEVAKEIAAAKSKFSNMDRRHDI